MEFFEGLTLFEKVLWGMAAASTPILVFQLIATFMGMDATDGGMDVDVDTDFDLSDDVDTESGDGGVSFQWWTFRNFIIFFSMFSWTGLACIENGISPGWSTAIAATVAVFMVAVVSSLFFAMARLQADQTPNVKHAVGKIARVYLPIPEKGIGKITVSIGGSTRELNARSKDGKTFPTGDSVRVVEMQDNECVVEEV